LITGVVYDGNEKHLLGNGGAKKRLDVVKISSREWHTIAGHKNRERKQALWDNKEKDIQDFNKCVPSCKTACVAVFVEHMKFMLKYEPKLLQFRGQRRVRRLR
jgi:hypothetical protein